MDKQRFKMRFIFWLEPDKPEQEDLIELIEELKENRLFAPVVRDGIRLEADLREGGVDVLLELHPWVAKAITAGQGVEDEIDSLRHEVELLKSVIAYMQNEQSVPVQSPQPGPRALTTQPTPPPAPDDDITLVMRKAESDGTAASENFLKSAFGLQK